jgi:hypothetical protein
MVAMLAVVAMGTEVATVIITERESGKSELVVKFTTLALFNKRPEAMQMKRHDQTRHV